MADVDEVEAVDRPDEAPDAGDDVELPSRRHTALGISLVVGLVAAAFVVVLATRDPATDRQGTSPLIGKPAKPLAGETLDGGRFDIGDQQGKWVVVNFFATWCLPCRQEHPQLEAFDNAHTQTGDAVLVSVLYENDPDVAREFFDRNGGDWPVVLDGPGLIATAYGVPQVPETYVIDPQGVVRDKLIGGVTKAGIEESIRKAEREDAQP